MFGPLNSIFGSGKNPASAGPATSAPSPATPPPPNPAPAAPAAVPEPPPDFVAISLKAVIAALPAALRPLILQPPSADARISVATARVIPQLATGAVRITFDELRQAAPAGAFANSPEHGNTFIALPLSELLPLLGPALRRRRADQKPPEPSPLPPGTSFFTSKSSPAHAPGSAAATAPVEPPKLTPISLPPPAAPAPDPASESLGGESQVISLPLASLAMSWPEPVRQEALKIGAGAMVELPREEVGTALKTGRALFSWGQIMAWLKPAAPAGISPLASTPLELPLKAIVGPFMASMRGAGAVRSAASPAPGALIGRMASITAAAPAPLAFPASSSVARAERSLGELLGQMDKRNWTPTEIVQRVASLPGLSGAMLSLGEGLVVAARFSEGATPELLAMSLPRLYAAAADQVRAAKLGELEHFAFSTQGVPWVILPLEKLYFTVQGRAGESLPLERLRSIAHEIGRQHQ